MAAIPDTVNTPLCSVCIANYNGMGLVEACIDSVLAQNWGERIEIIVHDDASTDGSAELIRQRYPAVSLLVSEHNVGFCVANNRMARQASGKYLLLLNNDAELMAGGLDTLLDAAENSTQPAILGLPQYDAQTGKLLDIGSLLDPFFNPVPNLDPERKEVAMVMGACLWLPKTLWEELGGFPEWFGSIGEDLYLCCVARLRGYEVRAVGTSGYRHHVGKSFGGGKVVADRLVTTLKRRALSERNKTRVLLLCCPGPLLGPLLPLHLLLLAFEGLVMRMARGGRLWQEIYAPALRTPFDRQLWQQRILLQKRRSITLGNWLRTGTWRPYKLGMLCRHGLPHVQG